MLPILSSNQWFELGDQVGNIILYSLPDYIEINIEIHMDQAIAHADDLRPRDRGQRLASMVRHLACSLSDNLYSLQQRKDQHSVSVEVCARFSFCERRGFVRCLEHVPWTDPVILVHRGSGLRPAPIDECSGLGPSAFSNRFFALRTGLTVPTPSRPVAGDRVFGPGRTRRADRCRYPA